MIYVKSEDEISGMRDACHIAAEVLRTVGKNIKVGITTKELENIAKKEIKSLGAISAFLGYRDYPGIICTSVNEVVVHGIPSSQKLKEGDIIGIDVGTVYNGFCGDTAKTYTVGKVSDNAKKLLNVSELSLDNALKNSSANKRIGDISAAIQKTAEENGFSVVRDFVGHGIGRNLHEDPQIPNYGNPGVGTRIPENCCLAIEVMINQGDWQVKVLSDKWTTVTKDNKLSAHFEHTVLVKKDSCEILTKTN
ncbi:MAG: type I methionyl aminopeptidase [Elusimicrobia bacterium]|nr:type I methionyl aminopeptidase [Elusimicrobiota bacterium]